MTKHKCPHCGLVTSVRYTRCQRCKQAAPTVYDLIDYDYVPKEKKIRRISLMPFLIVALVCSGAYAVWHYGSASGYKLALVEQPATAEAAPAQPANTALAGEKPILETVMEPADANVKTKGIKANLENSKIIVEANKRQEEMNKLMPEAPKEKAAK